MAEETLNLYMQWHSWNVFQWHDMRVCLYLWTVRCVRSSQQATRMGVNFSSIFFYIFLVRW